MWNLLGHPMKIGIHISETLPVACIFLLGLICACLDLLSMREVRADCTKPRQGFSDQPAVPRVNHLTGQHEVHWPGYQCSHSVLSMLASFPGFRLLKEKPSQVEVTLYSPGERWETPFTTGLSSPFSLFLEA